MDYGANSGAAIAAIVYKNEAAYQLFILSCSDLSWHFR